MKKPTPNDTSYDFKKMKSDIDKAVTETRRKVYKLEYSRNAKLSEKSQAFRYAQNYLGEINQVIKEKENSQTIELFPALHADFCYAIVQDNDTLLKYLPYVMTAFYWNSQTIKFPRLLEEIEKYNPKTDDDSVPTKSEKVNRKTVVDNLPTKIRKDINTLFTLSGVTHRNDGINYQKTKPVLRHEDAGFQAIYREVLETHLINRYYKEQKLLGLLLGLGYSQETVENLHATIKSVMRSKKSETEKAEKIVAELITQIPLEFFRKIQKLEINPVTLECLRSIREEVLDAFILSDKTKEKSQSSSISQRIESKVYRQSFTPFYSEGLSYYEGSSPVEQKLYFKHLYLAMLYSVFTLACFQDSKLQDKIDYTASYALFQEHTLSFHLHLDQDARFSLHDIKKSFYTKQLKNDTFLSYFSDNYIKNDTFKDTLSFLSESVEALECSNALRYRNGTYEKWCNFELVKCSLFMSMHDLINIYDQESLNRVQRNEASKERSARKPELEFDFDFLGMLGEIGDCNLKKQQEASEFIIGKLEEHLDLKDNGKRFNITKHLFAAVYHHRGES